MKNLQKLKGAKTLSKTEQQTINGGGRCWSLSECELNCNSPMWCSMIVETGCYGCVPSGSA